jgi:hypothetical protein
MLKNWTMRKNYKNYREKEVPKYIEMDGSSKCRRFCGTCARKLNIFLLLLICVKSKRLSKIVEFSDEENYSFHLYDLSGKN